MNPDKPPAYASCVPHTTGTAPPAYPVPEGATDCHHHIFDRRFPKAGKPMRAVGTVDLAAQHTDAALDMGAGCQFDISAPTGDITAHVPGKLNVA